VEKEWKEEKKRKEGRGRGKGWNGNDKIIKHAWGLSSN